MYSPTGHFNELNGSAHIDSN